MTPPATHLVVSLLRRGVVAVLAVLFSLVAASAEDAGSGGACAGGVRTVSVIDRGTPSRIEDLPRGAPFARYVEGLLPGLRTRFSSPGDASAGEVELRFLRRSLFQTAEADGDAGGSSPPRLDSPWLVVARTGDGPCALRIDIVWDERQILRDQADLAGAERGTSQGAARRPDAALISQWAKAYAEAAINIGPDEERQRRQKSLESVIPFEFLWLFRNAVQSTRGPFEGYASDAFDNLAERTEPAYRRLALALVDLALREPEADRSFSRIDEITPFFDAGSMKLRTIR